MATLLAAISLIASINSPPAAAGCWEPTTTTLLSEVLVGEEEMVVSAGKGVLVCEIGSHENATARAGCMDDAGNASFISVTEEGDTAIVTWNDEPPVTYRRCPTP